MTKFLEVNSHLVQVPDGVEVVGDRMFDFLVYKDFLIFTSEGEIDIDGMYMGPFIIVDDDSGESLEFESIELALEHIDSKTSN